MDRIDEMSPWWDRGVHADRQPLLKTRARIKAAVRSWFESQGFTEVETACLQVSPGNEAHLHAFATELERPDLSRSTLYLHTSPELAAKKLLAAGERKIFTLQSAFRNRERGPLHAPEFTLLEWYRADEPYEAVMDDCMMLLQIAAHAAESAEWEWRGARCNPHLPAERTTVAHAFETHAGIDLLASLGADGPNRDTFAAQAETAGIRTQPDDTWSDIFAKVLTALIEPQLGSPRATLLSQYPTVESALAAPCANDARLAQRFELYCCGVELANGFYELTDATEQRRRLQAQMDKKEQRYETRYPLDEEFFAALAHMPPASGCALGFDRLVMLATGATRLDQVIWTPIDGG